METFVIHLQKKLKTESVPIVTMTTVSTTLSSSSPELVTSTSTVADQVTTTIGPTTTLIVEPSSSIVVSETCGSLCLILIITIIFLLISLIFFGIFAFKRIRSYNRSSAVNNVMVETGNFNSPGSSLSNDSSIPSMSPEILSMSPEIPSISPEMPSISPEIKRGNNNANAMVSQNEGSLDLPYDVSLTSCDISPIYKSETDSVEVESFVTTSSMIDYLANCDELHFTSLGSSQTDNGQSFIIQSDRSNRVQHHYHHLINRQECQSCYNQALSLSRDYRSSSPLTFNLRRLSERRQLEINNQAERQMVFDVIDRTFNRLIRSINSYSF